jgi:hypothetical protein
MGSSFFSSIKDFLELSSQPLHRNGVTLPYPLESGLQLSSICMAEIMAGY